MEIELNILNNNSMITKEQSKTIVSIIIHYLGYTPISDYSFNKLHGNSIIIIKDNYFIFRDSINYHKEEITNKRTIINIFYDYFKLKFNEIFEHL